MATFEDGFWWSKDGLRLHYRDYPGGEGRPPVVCLPGLTRNARDFEDLAGHLSGDWRVICPELRGRGESAYAKDPMSYVPLTYVQDIEALLDELSIDRFIAIGTSLGGIITMLIAAMEPGKLVGAVLNDVGPEVEPAGVERIKDYVGVSRSHETWVHAARAAAEANGDVFPKNELEDWIAFAKRTHRLTPGGKIVLDYDMKIAEPFRIPGNETGGDLWPALKGLADVPTLILRGERSDLLSPKTVERMLTEMNRAELVTVPDVGHAPTLDEPEARAAIDAFLTRLLEPAA